MEEQEGRTIDHVQHVFENYSSSTNRITIYSLNITTMSSMWRLFVSDAVFGKEVPFGDDFYSSNGILSIAGWIGIGI